MTTRRRDLARCGDRSHARGHARGAQGGYVLLAVMLLAVLMVAGTTGYARYAVVAERHDVAALDNHSSREVVLSGLRYARQALAADSLAKSTTLTLDGRTVTIAVTDLTADRARFSVDSLSGGLGARLLAEVATHPSDRGALPALSSTTATAITGAGSTVYLTDGTVLDDVVLDGVVVIEAGASVSLNDVVVKGSIVSAPALLGPPYESIDATVVTVTGDLRVDAAGAASGLAVFLPDGSLQSHDASQLQIEGAVVAHTLQLDGMGAVSGPVLSETTLQIDSRIDRPGHGRGPAEWPDGLTHSTHEITWIAFPNNDVSAAEKSAVAAYTFPSKAVVTPAEPVGGPSGGTSDGSSDGPQVAGAQMMSKNL